MDNYTATEQAYKNGYEQGLKDAVKEGEWLLVTDDDEFWGEMEYFKCSLCGDYELRVSGTPYCPHCGARMKG